MNRQPNFTPKTTGKKEQKYLKSCRRKEHIKIRAEINEKEMKETIVKTNKTKSLFFEKIKKIKIVSSIFFDQNIMRQYINYKKNIVKIHKHIENNIFINNQQVAK